MTSTITFDKTSYEPGAPVTATISYTSLSATGDVASVQFPAPPASVTLTVVTAPPAPPPVFGCDSNGYAEVSAAIGSIPGYRGYNPASEGVPSAWPGGGASPIPAGVTTPVISIKPNIPDVLAGKLDSALAAYFKQVPAGAYVTCWHEGESAGNGFSASDIRGLHDHVYPIFRANAPATARYGQIITNYSTVTSRVTGWTAPGLDFYGMDGYDGPAGNTPSVNFGRAQEQLAAGGAKGPWAITETDSSPSGTSRAAWFEAAWAWAVQNKCLLFFPFFFRSGSGKTPSWDPSDTATIGVLAKIRSEAAA